MYKCFDMQNTNISMAMKITTNLNSKCSSKQQQLLSTTEINCLKQLSHPNVIKLLSFKVTTKNVEKNSNNKEKDKLIQQQVMKKKKNSKKKKIVNQW